MLSFWILCWIANIVAMMAFFSNKRPPLWGLVLATTVIVETSFFFVFKYKLVPKANKRKAPIGYRDYPRESDRIKLFHRVLRRIERTSAILRKDVRHEIQEMLNHWFHHSPTLDSSSRSEVSSTTAETSSTLTATSPEVSDTEEDSDTNEQAFLEKPRAHHQMPDRPFPLDLHQTDERQQAKQHSSEHPQPFVLNLQRNEMDQFLAWAFFGKEWHELEAVEYVEVQKMYKTIADRYKLVIPEGTSGEHHPRRLNIDSCKPLHRPLFLYMIVGGLKLMGNLYLRFRGFQKFISQSGLTYWHRPARKTSYQDRKDRMPLCFFHGIAPAGSSLYLPMVLHGLGDRDRDMFLFDNEPISSTISFHALTEQETVDGVKEALEKHCSSHESFSVCGHSFGSVPITWLLHSELKSKIRQCTLMDPVTILLSEPDVMVNFLYSRHQNPEDDSKLLIQLAASSELFTEYYLRRNFSWYNSELWLDDVHDDCQLLVSISEKDEIISALKVRREVEYHASKRTNIRFNQWKGAGHGNCLHHTDSWEEMRTMMSHQEEVAMKSAPTKLKKQ